MSNFLSNKKRLISNLGPLVFLSLFMTVYAIADTQITASYSYGINSAFPEIKNVLEELKSVRSSNFSVMVYNPSPINPQKAKTEILANNLDIMVVISSEIEDYNKSFFNVQNRIRESVLVSFIAVSPKVDHIERKPLSDISSNDTQPLLYPDDESSRKLLNDIVIECAQDTRPHKIVIKPAHEARSLLTSDEIGLTGILVKLIHFNHRVVGDDLLADISPVVKDFLGMPLMKSENNEKVKRVKQCVANMKSQLWNESLKYRIIFANETLNSGCRPEVLRDYEWIKNLELENLNETQIIEKTENIVLLLRGDSKEDADRRSDEFKRCLFDRYWNLQSDSFSASERAKKTNKKEDMDSAADAKEVLTKYVKGFYLLTTDTFPTVTFANDILLPDTRKYYSRIGDRYKRQTIVERLGEEQNPLTEEQLCALDSSIKKYEIYFNFRQDATDAGDYDLYLLYAMERFARLKKIMFDHYYLKSDANAAIYLKDAVDSMRKLKSINDKISFEEQYENIREHPRFDFMAFDDKIAQTLTQWEGQL